MASDLDKKIFDQVEYYFSDINFSKDNFLKDQSGKEDGWISIETLLTFKRLQAMTTNPSDVVSAFENLKSETIELNEAKDKLRRLNPLPEIDDEFKQNFKLRTVHFKGFPKEDTTLEEVQEFCKQYGDVEQVSLRRFEDKSFKGCCFTVYKEIESANKAISANDKFRGTIDLKLRENKETYFNRKFAYKNQRNKKENKLIDLNENEAKKDENDKDEENKDQQKNEKKEEEEEVKYETGCIIKLIDLPEKVTFRDIKPKLISIATVKYVDIFPETRTGLIRFGSKGDRDIVLKTLEHSSDIKTENGTIKNGETEKNESNGTEKKLEEVKSENDDTPKVEDVKVENKTPEDKNIENEKTEVTKSIDNQEYKQIKLSDDLILKYELMDGEEEKEHWIKVRKLTSGMNQKRHHNNHHKKKSRFGGYSHNNKNKRSANDDRDNTKKAKVDSEA